MIKTLRARGRPKGSLSKTTLTTLEAKKKWIELVHARLIPIFEALYEKAQNGDVLAIKELLDRAWGKATQGVEFSGTEGQPIVFMPLALIQKHDMTIEGEVVTPQELQSVQSKTPKEG